MAGAWLELPTARSWRPYRFERAVSLGFGADADLRLPGEGPSVACTLAPRDGGVLVRVHTDAGVELLGEVYERGARIAPERLADGGLLRIAGVPVVVLAADAPGPGWPTLPEGWRRLGALGSASEAMRAPLRSLALLAASPWPVWIGGPSGTGKELAAAVVHHGSPRAAGPLVTINCGALSEGTLLAELFGAERGAFTGADRRRDGAFVRAHGGTLLLDEVGELSGQAQAALLRVLETGQVRPLGGVPRPVDVRLVVATHRDLRAEVDAGRFRLDLLHRLAVGEVALPALADRPEDLRPLFARFVGEASGCAGPVSDAVVQMLRAHPWPGNVRELRNLARVLQATSRLGRPGLDELAAALGRAARTSPRRSSRLSTARRPRAAQGAPGAPRAVPGLDPQRARRVQLALSAAPRVSDACRMSGLPRSTFYRYLKALRGAPPEVGAVAANTAIS